MSKSFWRRLRMKNKGTNNVRPNTKRNNRSQNNIDFKCMCCHRSDKEPFKNGLCKECYSDE